MANNIQQEILKEKIDNFRLSFEKNSYVKFWDETKKQLRHAGEFGNLREEICRDFFRFLIPQRLSIGEGFIISRDNKVSTQCDIIIYDAQNTPLIEDSRKQRFFPIESVVAVGEVKSNLSKKQFSEALKKLAYVKEMRSSIMLDGGADRVSSNRRFIYKEVNPIVFPNDNIFTFLICNKLKFRCDNLHNKVCNVYEGIDVWNRHNLVLSLNDGILSYKEIGLNTIYAFPYAEETITKNVLSFFDNRDEDAHIKLFASLFFNNISSVSVFFPDMVHYIGDIYYLQHQVED